MGHLLIGLALLVVALLAGRITDDAMFSTLLIVLFGLIWAYTLVTDRARMRGDDDPEARAKDG